MNIRVVDITYEEVANTRQDFLIVQAAVIPTKVFPAPHGKTMIPERARLHERSKEAKVLTNGVIPISKHLAKTCLLIWTDHSRRLEVDL